MKPVFRIMGIVVVFCAASVAWLILGGLTVARSDDSSVSLRGEVQELWGSAQNQYAPTLRFEWQTQELVERQVTDEKGNQRTIREMATVTKYEEVSPDSTRIRVDLKSDLRRKGLVWYSLYDVDLDGTWTYQHALDRSGTLLVEFNFPDRNGVYDDFVFDINGQDLASQVTPVNGAVSYRLPVEKGQSLTLIAGYVSRGLDEWRYLPARGVGRVQDFELTMTTDFADIDFPNYTLSPNAKEQTDAGWRLQWKFGRVVTGHGVGMVMPQRIQPGELASSLSFSAPVSLLFFFLVMFVLATLRQIEIHPVNYLFLAGAFFAFHLLFAYLVDHVAIEVAFAVCATVSMLLVTSYMRLVVSNRFAFVEAAAAQLVYLIGFSLAHFWSGYTGLTVTVLAIVTLFLLMQLTGRIRWGEALAGRPLTEATS
ncbi:MAG: inner membrane CreD family protein [Myxococcota bacterium]